MEHKPQYMQDNSWRRSPFKCKEYGNGYTDLPTIFDSTDWPVTDTRVIPRVKTKKKSLHEVYFDIREVILDIIHINVKTFLHKAWPFGPVRELSGVRFSKCAKCRRVFPGKDPFQYISTVTQQTNALSGHTVLL